jgi:16S rRNA (cytosine967-C5)-methyltransferase
MELPFREHHLFQILHTYQPQMPMDLHISHYFKEHKALGSKDRGYLAETAYALLRWQGLLDFLCEGEPTWEKRFHLYRTKNLVEYQSNQEIPAHIRVSFPQVLYDLFVDSYGQAKAEELCLICNKQAPTTVRVNPLKTTREEMIKRWEAIYPVTPCRQSELGILFRQKLNFFILPEFKHGYFEVQDEGSQLLAALVKVEPGQQVLDYCAGSGGKTLAFAPAMQNKGQIFLHDIRPHALEESRKRLRRAGIQNAQSVAHDDETKLKKMKKKMHWVLVDAPCTGTGTLRRNPDMKWKFDADMLKRLVGQQRMIFERALSFMRPDGRIVYATCSLLKQENEEQLAHFQKTYGLKVEGEIFHSLPSDGGMDGFFGVVLKY